MKNVATIISGESFDLNEFEINSLVDAVQDSGGIIEDVKVLSPNKAVDIKFAVLPAEEAREIYTNLLENFDADFIVQNSSNRRKRLLISDMDSTIIKQECIDEIAECLGIKSKISEITDRAMNGELDFKEALRERVGLLKGVSQSELEEVFKNQITLTDGAVELVKTMNANGARTVLVSGGFTFFTQRVSKITGFQFEEANILQFDDSEKLSGEVKEPILDSIAKLNALKFHCEDISISPSSSLAVGDGANDLDMIKYSSDNGGLGVAFHAKPKVKAEALHHVNIPNLRSLLYVQGYSDSEIIS